MTTFLLRRAVTALILMLGVVMVTFVVFYVVPALGGRTTDQLAAQFASRDPSPEQLLLIKHRLGLDQPLYAQFWDYLKAMVVGMNLPPGSGASHCSAPCLGYSWRLHDSVLALILDRLPVTVSIAIGAAVLWLVLGVAGGAASAVSPGGAADRVIRIAALLGVCLPVVFIGPLARSQLAWLFPSVSYYSFLHNPFIWADHLILPWVTLALGYFALYTRLTRSGMIEALSGQFIRTAQAKGLPGRRVLWQALRTTLPTVATVFAMDLGLLLGGAVLAEKIYGLHGIGDLAQNGVDGQDLPVVLGVTLFAGLFIVVANFAVDAAYAVLDPRIRLD
ncbi:binding-protein-dependent transport systems inner membrane component [Catenulispora acidiphila DSM 44928]|uniref:Binding-protein-dependent transport systems inner membrane component n=1 Tax=Catenulispora acidiphila (strain DSM 44928 / JCM 14897 / NBRC 102108 / NRRL B-24433 / ID139908) TaxID=479433 RepID=C7Q7C4_CATAD|nr:ABC transporter permease [Catenulispora acidiphila]ACU70212.1 binding-protein-dependent transport systems inner membrane component [Catenulispora acidiphila DSM 44928]